MDRTARFPKELDSEEAGNLNSIVVFARGRLFHENILDNSTMEGYIRSTSPGKLRRTFSMQMTLPT